MFSIAGRQFIQFIYIKKKRKTPKKKAKQTPNPIIENIYHMNKNTNKQIFGDDDLKGFEIGNV